MMPGLMIVLAVIFTWVFVRALQTGRVSPSGPFFEVTREAHPLRYWLVTVAWGGLAMMMVYGAVAQLLP